MNSHRQSDRSFPNIDIFKDGLDKCQLSGTETVYKVYILYLCLIQTYVIETLPSEEAQSRKRFKKKKYKEKIDVNTTDSNKNTYVETVSISKFFYKKVGKSKKHLLK